VPPVSDSNAFVFQYEAIAKKTGQNPLDVVSRVKPGEEKDLTRLTQIRWVEGLHALWDGLVRAHPKLRIDNANWRITGPDIEVMSRSVESLTRSEIEVYGIPFVNLR
jgi:hypothetical protein